MTFLLPSPEAPAPRRRALWPLVGSLAFLGCSAVGSEPEGARLERMKASPQHRDGKFRNPVEGPMLVGSWWGLLKESFFGKQVRVPPGPFPTAPTDSARREPPGEFQVTWLGHSTVLLEIEGKRLLLDPVLGGHASPLPAFVKRFQAPPITRDSLPRVDAVIISHDHYDHLEMETVRHFAGEAYRDTPFLVPLGVGAHLEGWGVPPERIVELDWWEEHDLRGLRLVCTPSRHFSGRGLTDRMRTLWASWSLVGKARRVHYSGDGGYGPHFQDIGRRLGPFDLTLLENGAYDPHWPHVHMFPEEVVKAHRDLRGEILMPVHWGMFNLAYHAWHEPIRRLSAAAREEGVPLLTPKLGQPARPGLDRFDEAWWEPLLQAEGHRRDDHK